MEPLYFPSGNRQLFGVYHGPSPSRERDTGILICHPLGQEYIRSHRTLTHLARSLAEKGFSVLRFDYSCCGDSEGEDDQADLAHWSADITTALYQLQEGTNVTRLFLIGLRLGANLALQASVDHSGVTGIVLWDPIVDGPTYVSELQEQHDSWLKGSFCQRCQMSKGVEEILGFPLSSPMKCGLLRLNFPHMAHQCPGYTCLIDSEQPPQNALQPALIENLESTISYYHLPGDMPWRMQNTTSKSLVPKYIVDTITHWLLQVT